MKKKTQKVVARLEGIDKLTREQLWKRLTQKYPILRYVTIDIHHPRYLSKADLIEVT